MAQAFRRLGSEVVVLHADAHVLPREDPDAAAILEATLEREGVRCIANARIARVERQGDTRSLHFSHPDGGSERIEVDEILLGVGRAPNVEGLGLEAAGVRYDAARGVAVDDFLRTSNPRIFAAGDICMAWKFTHAADAAAKIVVRNALFALGPIGRARLSSLVMPWCTNTDPEIAHVGLYPREAEAAGIDIRTYKVPLHEVNRAVADGEDEGFVKVHVKQGSDEIVGATLVAAHAGEMISEVTLAMVNKIGLGKFLDVIHPYPTQAEGIKRTAGLYTRERATPTLKKWLGRFMALRR